MAHQPETTSAPRSSAASGQRPGVAHSRQKRGRFYALGAVGAVLAGTALFNRVRTRKAERETPPLGKFVEVDGVRLHYVDEGQGPSLVLIHGNGALIQDFGFSGVLAAAVRNYRVIAFDRPGFGYSERPRSTVWTPSAQAALIHKALRKIGVERPIVLGHSWGALVALAMALDHPEDVAALTLLSGYYFPTARPDVLVFSPPAVPLLGDLMRFTVSPVIGRIISPAMIRTMFAPCPVPDSFSPWPVEMALRPSQIRAMAADTALMVPAAAILSQRYEELDLPIVIMGGEGDLIAHFDRHAEALHGAIPGSELIKVPDTGHMFHYAVPDQIIAAIDRAAGCARIESSAPGEIAGAGSEIVPATATAF